MLKPFSKVAVTSTGFQNIYFYLKILLFFKAFPPSYIFSGYKYLNSYKESKMGSFLFEMVGRQKFSSLKYVKTVGSKSRDWKYFKSLSLWLLKSISKEVDTQDHENVILQPACTLLCCVLYFWTKKKYFFPLTFLLNYFIARISHPKHFLCQCLE